MVIRRCGDARWWLKFARGCAECLDNVGDQIFVDFFSRWSPDVARGLAEQLVGRASGVLTCWLIGMQIGEAVRPGPAHGCCRMDRRDDTRDGATDYFEAARSYSGRRPGKVFKLGPHALGCGADQLRPAATSIFDDGVSIQVSSVRLQLRLDQLASDACIVLPLSADRSEVVRRSSGEGNWRVENLRAMRLMRSSR